MEMGGQAGTGLRLVPVWGKGGKLCLPPFLPGSSQLTHCSAQQGRSRRWHRDAGHTLGTQSTWEYC